MSHGLPLGCMLCGHPTLLHCTPSPLLHHEHSQSPQLQHMLAWPQVHPHLPWLKHIFTSCPLGQGKAVKAGGGKGSPESPGVISNGGSRGLAGSWGLQLNPMWATYNLQVYHSWTALNEIKVSPYVGFVYANSFLCNDPFSTQNSLYAR